MKNIIKQKQLIRFFFNYQKKYLGIAIGAGVLLFINVLLQLPMPLITRYVIDNVIPAKNFKTFNIICFLLLGIILISQLSNYFMKLLIIKCKAYVHYDLERDLYFHVQELPISYFSKKTPGYILSRINEVSSVEAVMADTFFYILKDVITLLVGAVLILSMHLILGLVSLFVLPLFILSIKAFHKRIKGINKRLREENAQYVGILEKNINSIEKIKSSVKEESEGQRLVRKLSAFIQLRIKAHILSAFAGIVSAFIGMISPYVVLWFGISEIMRGSLTLGTFVAINSFLAYLYGPAQRLSNIGYKVSRALAGLERIYEVFNEPEEDKSGETVENIKEIVFDNVSFAYNGSDPVLKNLDLTIKQGQKVAVVGESGQGKSTLVKLLLKFYQPDSGHIYFSGKDSRDIAFKCLRRKIAYISQKQQLLEEEFIEKFQDRRVKSLLKKLRFEKAVAGKDIYQSEFSGGEVQKIELAESILKEAEVLIMDEGTSNIDYNSEKLALEELFNKYKDKIIIFIAHRLRSITDFERIVVIGDGRVLEQGTHLQLMKARGKYHILWGMQKKSREIIVDKVG
jgi:ABC-type bacteriocin/lantibiotic exporter with double-glycine peptidase domain